jgi:transglycosylase-like protein with SLT domain
MPENSESTVDDAAVIAAIRYASQATGVTFDYLLTIARIESGLDPRARARTTSARGLFQFLEQTWFSTIKAYGSRHGYRRCADAITEVGPGFYEVSDATLRQEILSLRDDPKANAVMAGAFTQSNATLLTQRLDRVPNEAELYIAHFLGASGAARMIKLAANKPDEKAVDYFLEAARANTSIFYERATGASRSFAQVLKELVSRYDRQRSKLA